MLELDLRLRASVEISSSTITCDIWVIIIYHWCGSIRSLSNNSCITTTLMCGSCGIIRLPCMYGLGSHYGPCILGLEILDISLFYV